MASTDARRVHHWRRARNGRMVARSCGRQGRRRARPGGQFRLVVLYGIERAYPVRLRSRRICRLRRRHLQIPKHKKTDAIAGLTSSRSVCVRLCDGFFFPVAPVSASGDLAGPEAACQNTCPDAPTALYIEPSGSDKIEDAVSTNGAPYTALPVALRSRKTLDNTCSCHRSSPRGYRIALLHDFTLRKGDAVMTPRGFMVFQGQKRLPFARRDFVSLKQAPVQGDDRMALLAMERASAANPPARGAGAGSPAAHSEN